MTKSKSSILFLGKHDDELVKAALDFCQRNSEEAVAHVFQYKPEQNS